MKALAFSDLHCDLDRAAKLVELSADADLVIGAGDFASVHQGLEQTIAALTVIETPTLLVPGNNETQNALRRATAEWPAATVLHGQATEFEGAAFFGLGAGIPVTPWDWSFDLSDREATRLLEDCPPDGILIAHSPPQGHVDLSATGEHLGSVAIRETIEAKRPRLAVCGHIHESWGERSQLGPTVIANLGPEGAFFEL